MGYHRQGLGQHGRRLKRHSWNTTVGYDFYDDGDVYAGALVAYSDNSLSGYDADGTYKNYSVGLYGGTKNRPGTVTAYMSYGRQENELTRYLGSSFSYSGASSKVMSDYDSTVFGVGAAYAYDLHYGKDAAGTSALTSGWITPIISRTASAKTEVSSLSAAAGSATTIWLANSASI